MSKYVVEDYISAYKYLARKRFPAYDFDDLVSVGTLSFYSALDNFDENLGTSFKHYATRVAFYKMLAHVELDNLVHVCRNVQAKFRNNAYKRHSFEHESIRSSIKREIINIEKIHPWYFDDNDFIEIEIEDKIEKSKCLLDERKKKILKLRYEDGFNGTEVAKILGMNKQRVYQLEQECIYFLRSKLW
jgi:RNA polymerase sigma factor (sigma-70 family)